MKKILLGKSDEAYLQKCNTDADFAYGIIIGQRAELNKYVVVHLAKNGEEEDVGSKGPDDIAGVDKQALTSQWISASKMIPGSFTVLGVFVVSNQRDIVEESAFSAAKSLLYDVHNLLIQGNNFCGSVDDVAHSDYLFLTYSTNSKKSACKSYTHSANGGAFTSMECVFVERPFEWHTFECSYEVDDVFPILDQSHKINIENQFQKTIFAVKKCLDSSEIFLQNESVDDKLVLDAYIKKKREEDLKSLHAPAPEEESYKATIFLPVKCQVSSDHPIKVREFSGTIRFNGVISSRVYCNPKNTIGDVKRFIRDDILRSLAARIQVYCDGLTEPNISTDKIFISEPPRRVYFNLQTDLSAKCPIQFSEYIFRGEAPTVALAQAKQVLDLDINNDNIVADAEGLPDEEFFNEASSEMQTLKNQGNASSDLSRSIYMLGIAVALMVLLVSILLHYVMWK